MNIKPPTSYSSKFYALRDIRKGEELLYDYDMYDTVWGKVGLGSEVYDDDDDDITTMMIVRRWRRQKMLSCNSRVENTMVHSRLSRNDLEKQRYWHSKKCKNKRNRLMTRHTKLGFRQLSTLNYVNQPSTYNPGQHGR